MSYIKSSKKTYIKRDFSNIIDNHSFRKVRNIVLVDSVENIYNSISPTQEENNLNSSYSVDLIKYKSFKEEDNTLDISYKDRIVNTKTISIKSIVTHKVSSLKKRQKAGIYQEIFETVKYIQNDNLVNKLFQLKSLLYTK